MSERTGACVSCRKPSTLRCSACHSVFYCGKDHQSDDWREHKRVCRAYKVKYSSVSSAYVVATRDIKKNEVIVDETPLVVGPGYISDIDRLCPGCHRLGPAFESRCPRCDWPICSPRCPGLTEPTRHGAECSLVSKIKSALLRHTCNVLLPLRCLLLQKNDPKKWKVFQKMAVSAVELSTCRDARESMLVLQEFILKPLAKIAPEMLPDCSEDTVKSVYAVLNAYGLAVHAPDFGDLIVVCGATSLMEHSCLPNTRRFVDIPPVDVLRPNKAQLQCRVVTRAAKDIRKGENITTLFVDTYMCTVSRQSTLAACRKTQCRCARCLDPRELGTDFGTLKCTKGLCTGWVLSVNTFSILTSDWKCGLCGQIYSVQYINKLLESLRNETNCCYFGEDQSVTKYEAMLKRLLTWLHPNHFYCLLAKGRLFRYHVSPLNDFSEYVARETTDDQLKRSLELGEELLRIMMNPAIVLQDQGKISQCLYVLSLLRIQTAHRKMASGEWTLAHADNLIRKCLNMIRQAAQLDISQVDVSGVEKHWPIIEEISLMLATTTGV